MPLVLEEQMNQGGDSSLSAACLGYLRIADPNIEALQWQLQKIGQGKKRCRQGDLLTGWKMGVICPDILRRKQIHRYGLIAQIRASSSRNLPIASEADAMSACLPGHDIVEVISASKNGRGRRCSDEKIRYIDSRCTDSKAAETVCLFLSLLLRTHKEIGKM